MSRPTDPTAGAGDDYVGPPPRPDPWTTSEPHEGMRDNHQARVISLAPDVCLTPCGSGSVPVPYPVVDYGDHMANYADSVRFTKQRAMVLRSNTTHVHGDEAGKDGGIKSGTYKGITEPIGHAPRVYAQKSQVIRDGDRHWMNYRNTVGEANFKRDTRTYDPPPDDDPIPGSMRRDDGRTQVAQAQSNIMTDASTDMFPANTSSAAPSPKITPPQPSAPPTQPGTSPPPSTPPANDNLKWYKRFGPWAWRIVGGSVEVVGATATTAGLAVIGIVTPTNKATLDDVVPQDSVESGLKADAQSKINTLPFDSFGDSFAIRRDLQKQIYDHRAQKARPVPDQPEGMKAWHENNSRVSKIEKCQELKKGILEKAFRDRPDTGGTKGLSNRYNEQIYGKNGPNSNPESAKIYEDHRRTYEEQRAGLKKDIEDYKRAECEKFLKQSAIDNRLLAKAQEWSDTPAPDPSTWKGPQTLPTLPKTPKNTLN